MKFDPGINHRRSIRLRNIDYSSAGAYFITICTQGRECLFGDVVDEVVRLNPAGTMIRDVWCDSPNRFVHVMMDEFIIMPNHFHGIIIINDRRGESRIRPIPPDLDHKDQGDCKDQGDQNQGDHKDRPYGTLDGSVGRVVQAFKSITTAAYIHGVNKHGWPVFPGRVWQRNYYERVIRNDDELAATREYIRYNPMKWAEDSENPATQGRGSRRPDCAIQDCRGEPCVRPE